jgi:hypothetical protein
LGAPLGGAWKTTNAGVSWFPIFDQFTNVDSVGAIQVAASDPNIVYLGTGDSVQGSAGDGMYKSTDAGKTWTHIGLEETTKINKMVIDPKDPNIVVASTQGDTQHNGRGIYRTTDGGKTWENTLRPENANGTRDVEYAFDMSNVIFATSQGAGGGFGGGGGAPQGPNGTALYKSTDEGKTWIKITTLPQYNGRISVAIAMHTNAQRVYVIGTPLQGASGLSRSDDGGQTWQHMAGDETRIANGQGNYSSGVWVDAGIPTFFTPSPPPSIDQSMAARPSARSRVLPAARTHTLLGSIRPTTNVFSSALIRARLSRWTAVKPGAAIIKSRSLRSTTSPPTINIRIG